MVSLSAGIAKGGVWQTGAASHPPRVSFLHGSTLGFDGIVNHSAYPPREVHRHKGVLWHAPLPGGGGGEKKKKVSYKSRHLSTAVARLQSRRQEGWMTLQDCAKKAQPTWQQQLMRCRKHEKCLWTTLQPITRGHPAVKKSVFFFFF